MTSPPPGAAIATAVRNASTASGEKSVGTRILLNADTGSPSRVSGSEVPAEQVLGLDDLRDGGRHHLLPGGIASPDSVQDVGRVNRQVRLVVIANRFDAPVLEQERKEVVPWGWWHVGVQGLDPAGDRVAGRV